MANLKNLLHLKICLSIFLLSSCVSVPINNKTSVTYWNLPYKNKIEYDICVKTNKNRSIDSVLNRISNFEKIGDNIYIHRQVMYWDNNFDIIKVDVEYTLVFTQDSTNFTQDSIYTNIKLSDIKMSWKVKGYYHEHNQIKPKDAIIKENMEKFISWESYNKKRFINEEFSPKINRILDAIKYELSMR